MKMRNRHKRAKLAAVALAFSLIVGCLYSFAGISDRLEPITGKQQAEVVTRWGDRR